MTFSVHENDVAIVYSPTIHHTSKLQGEWIQAVGETISRIVCMDTRKLWIIDSIQGNSMRTADAFPVVASLPPKNSDAISDDRKCVCCSQATKGTNQPIIAYIVHTHDPSNLCAKGLVPIFDINYGVKNYDWLQKDLVRRVFPKRQLSQDTQLRTL